jgi:hypothetical protein
MVGRGTMRIASALGMEIGIIIGSPTGSILLIAWRRQRPGEELCALGQFVELFVSARRHSS